MLLPTLLALASLPLVLQATRAPGGGDLVLSGAHVLDADGTAWREGVAVVVRDGRIDSIVPEAEARDATGAHVDLGGRWLVPGLIEMHSHLLLRPYDEESWDDQVLRDSVELRTIRGVVAARHTLEAGFTTIRDLGTEGAGWADVALRDAVVEGLIPGPRIVATTRAIVATGCYGPSGFDPRWQVPKGAQEATGVDGVRTAVREQVAQGADWIKVYADYRRRRGDPATPTFSQEELDALVDEATSAGRLVAAHASTDEGVRRAVLAGVHTIEHGTEASDATLALMQEHGVALCPTVAAAEAVSRYAGWEPGTPDPPRLAASRDLVRRARAAGVTIALGSDVGVFPHGTSAREAELLVECGFSPGEALAAGTRVAADVLQRPDLGRIAPGAVADLVALDADPLAAVTALRQVSHVIQAGRVVRSPAH